jgi:macrolide transport system ATP-binding/permease protein
MIVPYSGSDDAHHVMIAARQLDKTYTLGGESLRVLKNVGLDIPAGQFVAIMGPSGSGKSTLLHLLGGLDRPSAGMIAVAGRRLDALSSDELAFFRGRTIGFVFQSFHLVPTLTALENVALPGIFAGWTREEREARAGWLLGRLGMGDRAGHRPSQLSGGQQQRVAIARALFSDPPIIMGDEPTGALDSKTGQLVMRWLRALREKRGKTVLVVTHDEQIAAYADRMIRLQDGRIVSDEMIAPQPTIQSMKSVAAATQVGEIKDHESVEKQTETAGGSLGRAAAAADRQRHSSGHGRRAERGTDRGGWRGRLPDSGDPA